MAATATATAPNAVDQELRDKLQVAAPNELVKYLNALVYGEAGAGKTYLSGTAADSTDTAPLLIIDIEGGMTTLRKRKNVDVITARSIPEISKAQNDLYYSIKTDKAGVKSIYYKTVCLDSITELADLDMRTVMKEAYNKNPDKVHIDVPSPREWGIVRNHMRLIVRSFRDLPCNVIFTAGLGSLSEEGQPTKYFPGFAGKLAREIPGFMDIVGYLYAESDGEVITRKLQTVGTRRVVAKDRTSALGDLVENPTVPMLWELINAK